MPGPITYAAIALLARDRLGQIRRALVAKQSAGPLKEIESHVLFLATQAEQMMSASQPVIDPPVRLYGPPLTDHVSRFMLLGAMGPDLPRYAAYFVPGQRWLFDTLHKGSPDTDREHVLIKSTDLVFDFWSRVGPLIDAAETNEDKRKQEKQKMQAYVLGHLCHVAADALSHPYFESLETRLSTPGNAAAVPPLPSIRFMTRDDVTGAFDTHIAATFFARGTDTHTKQWADWFPTSSDMPSAFGQAMFDSITALYGGAPGMPAFDEAFKKLDPAPPPLSADLIREGIDSFRTIVEIERVWTLADWLGATAATFLPLGLAYFGAIALPHGDLSKTLTPADGPDADAIRTYETVVYPLAVSSLGPLVSMIIVSASGRGLRAEGVTGWIQAGLSVVATVGFFTTLGGAGAARWVLFFALPLVLAVAQIIFVIARGAKENSRKLLFLGPLVQVLLSTLFMLLYRAWLHEGVEEFHKDGDARDNGKAWGYFAAWMGIVLVLWFVHAVFWRWVFSSSVPDDQDLLSTGEPRQFLRLYDDVSLLHDLAAPITSEKLSDLAYPPARRPLLKLVWQAGTQAKLQIQIQHDRLVFHWPGLPAGTDTTVFAPLVPTTVAGFATSLARIVTGDAGKGTLHVTPVRDDEKGAELSPGTVFGDAGDDKTAQKAHDDAANAFTDIGTTDAAPFTLFHTVRPRLAERMGRSGTAPDTVRAPQGSKPGCQLNAVAGSTVRLRSTAAGDGSSPLLRKLFRPGDIIQIATAPPQQRIVQKVENDTDIVVSSPPSPALAAAPAAGVGYQRLKSDRTTRVRSAGQVQLPAAATLGIGPNDVVAAAAGNPFGAQFMAGDVVEFVIVPAPTIPVRRTVVAVKDGTLTGPAPGVATDLLQLDAPPPALAGPVFIDRLTDEEADGFLYVADENDAFGDGGSVMNDAADLAALLCLGAASRINLEGSPQTPPGATKTAHRVTQIFRNWNLDRRRVNEWKMMVSGGASSERRGDYRAPEEAAPPDRADAGETFSDAFVAQRRTAEATVLEHGWLSVFRSWVDMASRPRNDVTTADVFVPGGPTNLELSRALAYLLDSAEGVA